MKLRMIMVAICLVVLNETMGETQTLEQETVPSLVACMRIKGPVDFCGEPMPLTDPEIRERLERELLFMIWNRPQVILWIKRSAKFMPYIEKVLQENQLPDDLKYVAVAESSLMLTVSSPKAAVGFWQFIAGTGQRYGLRIDKYIDERRNFEAATLAALGYLKKLYDDFGSWTLAAAAYNMGEAGLQRNISEQKTEKYYYLYLPEETQRYVFRIIGAKLILSNPEKYGFVLTKEDLYVPVETDTVRVECPDQFPIQMIAEAAGTYYKVIRDLNPQFKGKVLPRGVYDIQIPKGSASNFYAQYRALFNQMQEEKELKTGTIETLRYVVKRGDTLSRIAQKYGVSEADIQEWNREALKRGLQAGQKLIIYLTTDDEAE